MFIVSESEAEAIRRAYEDGGELSAAVELRRLFPGIADNGLVVTSVPKVPIWKVCDFNALRFRLWDRRKIGGQAAIAIGEYVSLAGWNFCP